MYIRIIFAFKVMDEQDHVTTVIAITVSKVDQKKIIISGFSVPGRP